MTEPEEKSTPALLGDAMDQMLNLVRGEIALAQAEIHESLRRGIVGLGLMIVAAVIAGVALHVLAGAAIAALVAQGFSPTSAALVVAVGLLVIALVLVLVGAELWKALVALPRHLVQRLGGGRSSETPRKGSDP